MKKGILKIAGDKAAPFLAVILLLSGNASAVDFKGVELGETLWITEEKSVFGMLDCNPMQMSSEEYQAYMLEMQVIVPGARKVCAGSTSIATIPADVTVLLGTSRRVLRLTFQFAGEDYARVLDAMTEKWGEGAEEVRDRFDTSVWWVFEDGTSISVHQMPDADVTTSSGNPASIGLAEYALLNTTPAGDL